MTEKQQIELVEAALAGDIESFGKLCQCYYPALVAIGYSVLTDHQLAEDAAQESFARALISLKKLKNKYKFAPWLAAICRNVAKDMVAKNTGQINTEAVSQIPDRPKRDNSDVMVYEALDKLPDSDKELIVLRYYDNSSYEEISSVLGISGAAINGRLTRAKRKIAKYLKQIGFSESRL